MALNRKPNPTGVDELIDRWQKVLYDGLTNNKGWLKYDSNSRAYKLIEKDKVTKAEKTNPKDFSVTTDYRASTMSDDFNVTSFFLVSNITEETARMNSATISVIFQADLKKLYPTSLGRFDEELINDVKAVSRSLGGRFKAGATARGIEDVYAGLDTAYMKDNKHDHEPYNVVRFDMNVTYQHFCTDVYATSDCTISVSVATTDETAEGADDGTASAIPIGGQGDLTYSWTGPNGFTSILKDITGLESGVYNVVVVDDNAINCNASASGTVAEGSPAPTCNLVIDSVDQTGTTEQASAGTATVNFSGNAGAVGIIWEDGQTSSTAIDLPLGNIGVCVVDLEVGMTCARAGSVTVLNSNINYLAFDQVNDWVDLASHIRPSGAFTFQVEFFHNDFTAWRPFITDTNSYAFNVEDGGTAFRFFSNNVAKIFDVPALSIHTWYRVLLISDGVDVRLYLNNVESTTGALPHGNFRMDRIGALSSGSRPFGGGMDNIGFAMVDVDSTQRAALELNPADFVSIVNDAPEMEASFLMNETGDATTITNDADGANNGTLSGYLSGGIRFESRDNEI